MRALSVLVLAIFMTGPGLRAECLLLCTQTGQPAARSGCHDEPADGGGAAISTHHDCAVVAPVVITIKRASTDSTASFLAGSPQSLVVDRAARPERLLHGPPRHAPRIPVPAPLRI